MNKLHKLYEIEKLGGIRIVRAGRKYDGNGKKIQQNVEEVQSRLKDERVEVSTGDVIKIIMNGQQELYLSN